MENVQYTRISIILNLTVSLSEEVSVEEFDDN